MKKFRSLLTKPSLSFQILSDLHLEVGHQYSSFKIPTSAPYLILAGDIGRLIDYDSYLAFLAGQTARFEIVFLLLGNHEFYELSFAGGMKQAQKLEREPILNGKLVLLNQTRFDIPNSSITILGCTLWSQIADKASNVVQLRVKDFQKIDAWTVDDHNAAHESDIAWLKSQVVNVREENKSIKNRPVARRILIVTHHAPSVLETASPDHIDNPWSSAFATDLLTGRDGEWANVKAWVFGHTHFTTQFKKCGITVLSNQRGYVLPGAMAPTLNDRVKGKEVFDVARVLCI